MILTIIGETIIILYYNTKFHIIKLFILMKSLEKVFKIVDLLDEKPELKFTEIVNLSNLDKSIVYGIFKIKRN